MSDAPHLSNMPPADEPEFIGLQAQDLTCLFSQEPRILDLTLGAALGLSRPWDIRKLIRRNIEELDLYGPIVTTEERGDRNLSIAPPWRFGQTGTPPDDAQEEAAEAKGSRRGEKGRAGTAYWLNEGQALALVAMSEGQFAALVRYQLITTYIDFRAGRLRPRPGDMSLRRLPGAEIGVGTLHNQRAHWRGQMLAAQQRLDEIERLLGRERH